MNRKDVVNWFELHVADFDRAKKFYETILQTHLEVNENNGMKMGMFPCDYTKGVGGAINRMEGCPPGPGGTVVYLNAEGDLDGVLDRIPKAGGAVLQGRMGIGEHGFIGIFKDSEGNVVGLHSMT
jgi:predicted enzyme related to lactoylglutathione lyase